MTKSEQNLRDAFAGESQANRKYLAFAEKADKEGYPQVAKLFRAAAAAETVHAHSHLKALGGIMSTAENLKEAIAGETHEFKNMYPAMIEAAKGEGNKAAEPTFTFCQCSGKDTRSAIPERPRQTRSNLGGGDYQLCAPSAGVHLREGTP